LTILFFPLSVNVPIAESLDQFFQLDYYCIVK
jgi:hypothetical protein